MAYSLPLQKSFSVSSLMCYCWQAVNGAAGPDAQQYLHPRPGEHWQVHPETEAKHSAGKSPGSKAEALSAAQEGDYCVLVWIYCSHICLSKIRWILYGDFGAWHPRYMMPCAAAGRRSRAQTSGSL
jgi:hypothetical protein